MSKAQFILACCLLFCSSLVAEAQKTPNRLAAIEREVKANDQAKL
jgi:hypothetical protein